MLKNCMLCPRKCGVNREEGEIGYCGMGADVTAARAALHYWEEPCISGERGSGTVFFSGCTLKCVYCQNRHISHEKYGKNITTKRLAEIFIEQQQRGAHNINLVTPTHFVPHIIKAIDDARDMGLNIPIVYNSSGYENVKTLKMLEGYIDIYMPDFKYFEEESARRYSKAPMYTQTAKSAIEEMVRQCPDLKFDDDGIMQKGVIVRHMILPGKIQESKKIIEYLYYTYENKIFMSIMNQYTPINTEDYPEINKKVTDTEYDDVLDFAVKLGVENAFIQEGDTAEESFIPIFDSTGI